MRFLNFVRFHRQRNSGAHKQRCSGIVPTLVELKTPPELAVNKIASDLSVHAA